jgi:uncharacterized membrane protein
MTASSPGRADRAGAAARPAVGGLRRITALPRAMGWPQLFTFVLCVLGLVDSAYQVITHYTSSGLLGCSAKTDACVLLQNSPQAYLFGIPVAVYGVVFYVFMLVICTPAAWRSSRPVIGWARLASAVIGIGFVLFLIYREVVERGLACAYCTSVHVITFLVFALILFQASSPGALRGPRRVPAS